MSSRAALVELWRRLLGAQQEVTAAGGELFDRYAEPHRRYHDLRHLAEVLDAARALAGDDVPPPVLLAAFWHDAVYVPTASQNEERSAELADRTLTRLGRTRGEVDEVVRLVLLTRTHDPADQDAAGALLCDADLAILAAPRKRYSSYVRGVRQEYGHLSDDEFRRGRLDVLRALDQHEHLFRTTQGRSRWEVAARQNLQSELAELGADPQP